MLIVNADDLGRATTATDNILRCYALNRVTSTSAMVFMTDSERAAELALASGIDLGLHINYSEAFSGAVVSSEVRKRQEAIRTFVKTSKYALVLFNPLLSQHFRYVFDAQLAEFVRLYRRLPSHFDGHQHMHLATNMLVQRILPKGAKVRRSFSFEPGEKGTINRWYRAAVDRSVTRRHRTTDYFFSVAQNQSVERLGRIIQLAQASNVELMTHPQLSPEYDFLTSDWVGSLLSRVKLTGYDAL